MSEEKNLSKIKAMQEEFNEFYNEFKTESDRAAVVLGAANLDNLLRLILIKYLLPTTNNHDDLFDGDGPLSTFRARIDLCYRLGLADNYLTNSLHLIRKIRNSFAHELNTSLNSGSQRDRVIELASRWNQYEEFDNFIKKHISTENPKTSDIFREILAIVTIRLHGLRLRVKTNKSNICMSMIPPFFDNNIKDEEIKNKEECNVNEKLK